MNSNWRTSFSVLNSNKTKSSFISFLHIARHFTTSSSSWLLHPSKTTRTSQNFCFILERRFTLINYSKEMRYRYKGGKIEVVICNTRGIEIVRCHAATSTIHKLEGRRREDRGKVKMYSFKIEDWFYGNLQPLPFLDFRFDIYIYI